MTPFVGYSLYDNHEVVGKSQVPRGRRADTGYVIQTS